MAFTLETSDSSVTVTSSTTNPLPQDISNAYYVHPNENPSAKLITALLDGQAQAMTLVLKMKNKIGFVDCTISKPHEQHPNYSSWKRCNNLIRSWINHPISPDIATSILWPNQASEVWNALRTHFSQGDCVWILQLNNDLYSTKQGDLSVTSYFTKLRILWDKLCNFCPIPTCDATLVGSSKAVQLFKKYRDCDTVLCFLHGLNEPFAFAKSQILMLDPLPSLDQVFSMILQQERQLHVGVLPTPTLLTAQAPPNASQGRGKAPFKFNFVKQGHARLCTHCNRTNHIIDTCFLKHGFPPGWKSKKYVHDVAIANLQPEDDSDPGGILSSLTKDQIQSLLALLPSATPTADATSSSNVVGSSNLVSSNHISTQPDTDNVSWILDTGATDNFACFLNLFASYRAIKPILVALPNGKFPSALFRGIVVLTNSLILYDVLFIEHFSVNIISITKLTKSLDCQTIFAHKLCFLQQIYGQKMIGTASTIWLF